MSLSGGGVWQRATNASRGASRMGVFSGHSAGVGGVFRSVGRVRVSLSFCPHGYHENNSMQTHTHTEKRLEDLPKSLFKLTQVSWFPRATPLQRPSPPLFYPALLKGANRALAGN